MLEARFEKRLVGFTLKVELEAGNETLALLGASGAGKTMALRCLAGLMRPDSGRIAVDGRVWFDSERRIDVRPQERGAGLLFQSYALFPNMTVRQNLLCGLRHGTPRAQREREAARLLECFCLQGLRDRLPGQLSGGQQQRVALARCLAGKPALLLLDEPFAALDEHLRWRLMQQLGDTLGAFPGTALYVTHDRSETRALCQRVCVMRAGRMQPSVPTEAWYHAPATVNAAQLAGFENVLEARPCEAGLARLAGTGAAWPCDRAGVVAVAFRAADASLQAAQKDLAIRCRMLASTALETVLAPEGGEGVLLRGPAQSAFAPGNTAWLCVPPTKVVWLQREES